MEELSLSLLLPAGHDIQVFTGDEEERDRDKLVSE
jgi:hypothetical protein